MIILFDLEANDLLPNVTELHCICTYNLTTSEYNTYSSLAGNLDEGVDVLRLASTLIGHNIIGYDLEVLKKLKSFSTKATIRDTLIISRMMYIHEYMEHSLEAWGERLKFRKGDFGKQNGFATVSPEMVAYCEQDVRLTLKLWEKLRSDGLPPDRAIHIEQVFARELDQMMINGVPFDLPAAKRLEAEVRATESELRKSLPIPDFVEYVSFTPKVNNAAKGYIKNVPTLKKVVTEFNPNSRQQVERFFKEKYNWVPSVKTEKGNTVVNASVLEGLPYPEAKSLVAYFDCTKLLGQLADGPSAWLGKVTPEGKIHGRIIHAGCVTHRCSHSSPNMGQIPSHTAFKGEDCRKLFYAPEGYKFVGCDAAGLELRMLAHYMAEYDGGEYAKEVLDGDIHTKNQLAAELETRNLAKTFIYAFLYGAGSEKLGSIIAPNATRDMHQFFGGMAKKKFFLKIPAMKTLIDQVQAEALQGYVYALDGRKLYCHSSHVALNVLLQGGGAIVMKVATNICMKLLRDAGIPADLVLHVHDEYNFIVPEKYAEQTKEIAERAIELAGKYFKMRIPMKGEGKIGNNWLEVH